MNTMTAIFTGDTVDRLLPLYLRTCESHGDDYNLAAGNTWGGDTQQVYGPAQEVMFFIGFVATHGEDGLVSVSVNTTGSLDRLHRQMVEGLAKR